MNLRRERNEEVSEIMMFYCNKHCIEGKAIVGSDSRAITGRLTFLGSRLVMMSNVTGASLTKEESTAQCSVLIQ